MEAEVEDRQHRRGRLGQRVGGRRWQQPFVAVRPDSLEERGAQQDAAGQLADHGREAHPPGDESADMGEYEQRRQRDDDVKDVE